MVEPGLSGGVAGVGPPQQEADTLYPFVVEGTDGVLHPPPVVADLEPQDIVVVLLEIRVVGFLLYISVSCDAEHEYENVVLDEVFVLATHISCLRLSSLFSECRT